MLMMKYVDFGLKRPANIHLAIMEKLLMVIGDADIGTRTATIPPITHVPTVNCCVYLLLLIAIMKVVMTMKHVIVEVTMEDVELCHKIPDTINLKMMEKVLMVMGEVYIGIRPPPLPLIIQVILVDCWIFLFMVMT